MAEAPVVAAKPTDEVPVEAKRKIPTWVKIGAGAFDWAFACVYTIYFVFFMYFATDVVGIGPATVGALMMVASVWDAISDPIVGNISDHSKNKNGRRRPFILAASLPFAIITWLLFTDFQLSPALTNIYFLVMFALFFICIDFIQVPGCALAAEMSMDYDERTSILSWRAVWDQISTYIGGAYPLLVVAFFATYFNGNQRAAWSAMGAFFGVTAIFPILFTWRATKGYELKLTEPVSFSWSQIKNAVFKNRPFWYVLGMYTVGNIGNFGGAAVFVYYWFYRLGLSEAQLSLYYTVYGAATVFLLIPLFNRLAHRIGKRKAAMIAFVFSGVLAGIVPWFIQPGSWAIVWMLIGSVLILGVSQVALFQLVPAMIPDITEVDELRSGNRREGLYYSVTTFMQKIATAIGVWLVGIMLEATGYIANAETQTPSAITGIIAMFALLPAVTYLVAAGIGYFYPLSKQKHHDLLHAIALKREGKPYDENALKGLV